MCFRHDHGNFVHNGRHVPSRPEDVRSLFERYGEVRSVIYVGGEIYMMCDLFRSILSDLVFISLQGHLLASRLLYTVRKAQSGIQGYKGMEGTKNEGARKKELRGNEDIREGQVRDQSCPCCRECLVPQELENPKS